MADIIDINARLKQKKPLKRRWDDPELAAESASELVRFVMPHLIETYAEYGLRFTEDDRYYKHFTAIHLLLYVHTCEQMGYEHPMIDFLDEVSLEVEALIEAAKGFSYNSNSEE